jgi:FkbM family methyltransferase
MSHSQNDEEAVLLDFFGDRTDGRFLDIGAYQAVFSNTLALAERSWTGVAVEPSPTPFLALQELYKDRPGVELVNVAVAAEAGLAAWFDSGGDAVSTLNTAHAAKWAAGGSTFRRWTVATTTPAALLDRYGRDFDLISLDVEGNSAALLRSFPIADMPRVSAIVVEHDGQVRELSEWLSGFGFTLRAVNNENAIYTR